MSDFRVPLPESPLDSAQRELDWEEAERKWFVSERDNSSSPWIQNLTPAEADLRALNEFFRLEQALDPKRLRRMSPGELTQVHEGLDGSRDILAELCPDCGQHWLITKQEADGWRRYGRTCDFRWHRGILVQEPVRH